MFVLEVVTGLVIAIGVIIAVFWFTFRDPPPRRPADSTTAFNPNSDVDYLIRSLKDNGSGGFGG